MMKTPAIEQDEHYGIKILKNGVWLYNGTPINRHNLVKLFASVLKKDEKGGYWLVTPYEKGRIEVEDVPFAAVELRVESSGKGQKLFFRTSLDEWVEAGEAHPLRVDIDPATQEPSPYVMVRDGLEARIGRAVYYELVKLACPSENEPAVMGVYSNGAFYPVGKTET